MKDAQILQKAIEKALNNGWNFLGYKNWDEYLTADHWEGQAKDQITTVALWWTKKVHHMEKIRWEVIIYSHDFAKAFWGESSECAICLQEHASFNHMLDVPNKHYPTNYGNPVWQYHLQQMVLEEKPVRYLERFLT